MSYGHCITCILTEYALDEVLVLEVSLDFHLVILSLGYQSVGAAEQGTPEPTLGCLYRGIDKHRHVKSMYHDYSAFGRVSAIYFKGEN